MDLVVFLTQALEVLKTLTIFHQTLFYDFVVHIWKSSLSHISSGKQIAEKLVDIYIYGYIPKMDFIK